jgi:two-component system, sporulation sensor kinase D
LDIQNFTQDKKQLFCNKIDKFLVSLTRMNLYSNKQRWKILLLAFALIGILFSLYYSNRMVQKIALSEKERAQQWAIAIQKKAALIRLTNRSFEQLKEKEREKMKLWIDATKEISKPFVGDAIPDYSFPLEIIKDNNDIPVILMDNNNQISGEINTGIDSNGIVLKLGLTDKKKIIKAIDDSLKSLANSWRKKTTPFSIDVYEGYYMTYYFTNSYTTLQLESDRDSLINAFQNELIENQGLVPVILMEEGVDSIIATNISKKDMGSDFRKKVKVLASKNVPIAIDYGQNHATLLYFDSSAELEQLRLFPYVQFVIIGFFALVAYILFSTFRKAEQNQVWAGMAKETAHQLGTPLSSLMAWIELLKDKPELSEESREMERDILRLVKVSERFSKIGSTTQLRDLDIKSTVSGVIAYLRPRISAKVTLSLELPEENIEVLHNAALMEWVFENMCNNAVDAMEGKGDLTIRVSISPEWVHIDVKDSGKGLSPKQFKAIFKPGFTTKKRGWGLGLSLVKRIVTEYHKGKVFVLESEPNVGTTIRVSLKG